MTAGTFTTRRYIVNIYTTVYCMWNVLVTLTKQVLDTVYSIVLIVVDYLRKDKCFLLHLTIAIIEFYN